MKIMLSFLGILGVFNLIMLGGVCMKHFLSVKDQPQKHESKKEEWD